MATVFPPSNAIDIKSCQAGDLVVCEALNTGKPTPGILLSSGPIKLFGFLGRPSSEIPEFAFVDISEWDNCVLRIADSNGYEFNFSHDAVEFRSEFRPGDLLIGADGIPFMKFSGIRDWRGNYTFNMSSGLRESVQPRAAMLISRWTLQIPRSASHDAMVVFNSAEHLGKSG